VWIAHCYTDYQLTVISSCVLANEPALHIWLRKLSICLKLFSSSFNPLFCKFKVQNFLTFMFCRVNAEFFRGLFLLTHPLCVYVSWFVAGIQESGVILQ